MAGESEVLTICQDCFCVLRPRFDTAFEAALIHDKKDASCTSVYPVYPLVYAFCSTGRGFCSAAPRNAAIPRILGGFSVYVYHVYYVYQKFQ